MTRRNRKAVKIARSILEEIDDRITRNNNKMLNQTPKFVAVYTIEELRRSMNELKYIDDKELLKRYGR